MMNFKDEIYNAAKSNALIFMNKAIEELVCHNDHTDAPLDPEIATISSALLQVAFELSLVAFLVKKEGIAVILTKKDKAAPESVLREKFLSNELKTRGFDDLLTEFGTEIFSEIDLEHIKTFQNIRNKLMHLAYLFAEGDRYDLKYELTYFACCPVLQLISEDGDYLTPFELINQHINHEAFKKLIRFPPYIHEMERQARLSSEVMTCIHCSNHTLAKDDLLCYVCNWEYEIEAFADCPSCTGRLTLIFDHLNIHLNGSTMRALCLQCGADDYVYQCPRCEEAYSIENLPEEDRCRKGHCKFYDEE